MQQKQEKKNIQNFATTLMCDREQEKERERDGSTQVVVSLLSS